MLPVRCFFSQVPIRVAGLSLIAVVSIAGLVTFDSHISALVPENYWSLFGIYDFPYKSTLAFTAAALVIGTFVAFGARAREAREIYIVVLLSTMQMVGLSAGGFDGLDLITVLLLAILLAQSLQNPSNPVVISSVTFFAIAFVIIDLPYLMIDSPVHFVVAFIKFVKTVLLAFIVVNLLRRETLFVVFVRALVAVAFVSASIGLAQVIVFGLTGQVYIFAPNLDDAFKPTPWGMMLRAHGLNPEPHTLLSFLLVSLPFALYYLVTARNVLSMVRAFLTVSVVLAAIFLTWSYGGIAAALVILVIFPFFIWPNKSIHMLLGLVLIPILLYYADLADEIVEMVRSEASVSTGIFQRMTLMSVAVEEMWRNPWIGRGFDTVADFSGNYWFRTVHNAYAQAWAYTGLIGFILFVILMLGFATRAFILGFKGNGPQELRFRVTTVALLGLMFLMLSEPFFNSPTTWVLLGFTQAAILQYQTATPARAA